MQFVYYTEQKVNQGVAALKERLEGKARFEGWAEKDGRFMLATSGKVAGRFKRTTRLYGRMEREGSVTVIRGHVSEGMSNRDRWLIVGGVGILGMFVVLGGNLLLGIGVIIAGLALNIPLMGDRENSRVLTAEVQRALKARTTPPAPTSKAPPKPAATLARPAAKKLTPTKKPPPTGKSTTKKMF